MTLFRGTMKTAITSFCIAVFALVIAGSAQAAGQVYFSIQHQGAVILNRVANLPAEGTVTLTDNTGSGHSAPARSVLAVLSEIDETSPEFGISVLKYFSEWSSFFIDCMATPANPSMCGWWQYRVNEIYPDLGMDSYILSGGETVYVFFDSYQPVSSFTALSSGGSGNFFSKFTQSEAPHREFNADKAIRFLENNQNESGLIGSASLYSDWAAIALGAGGESSAREKLRQYLLRNPSPGQLLTDYERRAMALLALGLDPYSSASTNYIQKIMEGFDGTQFGDPNLINDDIFALIPLLQSGYTNSDKEIAQSIAFLLRAQREDGSWGGDTDMTSSAVQALSQAASTSDVQDALLKARAYLTSKQNGTGGFGNIYSTSWAMQAISALQERPGSWSKNSHTPEDYVEMLQAEDGGIRISETDSLDNRIWATSYAIPASLEKTWGDILVNVFRQTLPVVSVEKKTEAPLIQAQQEKIVLAQNIQEAQELAQIQREVERIKGEVAVLKIQVGELYSRYLASLPKEAPLSSIAAESSQENSQEQVLGASIADIASQDSPSPLKGILFAGLAGLAIFFLVGGSASFMPLAKKLFFKAQV